MKKTALFFVFLVLFLMNSCSYDKTTGRTVKENYPAEVSEGIFVYFCPEQNCESIAVHLINSSKTSVHCAFYAINLKNITKALVEKSRYIDVKVVIDDQNYDEKIIHGENVKKDNENQLMHNKFCIFDRYAVLTGSFNPTFNDNYRNNNNLVVIYSKYIAENYEDEFNELFYNIEDEKTSNPIILLNNKKILNYFCPEDKCSEKIIGKINKANKSIYFMSFSFTNEDIANALLFASNKNIDIKGIFEKSNLGQYSQYQRLKDFGLDVKLDSNKYRMHHKVFIIDNETVITGSFNPTKSADERNDENILIIEDKVVAVNYLNEFQVLFA